MNYTAVITTINQPTKAVKEFAKMIPLIVIGDEKTPKGWKCEGVKYYDSSDEYITSYNPPVNHYSRKNLGYIQAMIEGADCIYDTDDDNIPNENWKLRDRECLAMEPDIKGWFNVYKCFTHNNIWPRGLPLNEINSFDVLSDPKEINSPIHQGLADKSPDVDAIWRMVFNKETGFTYQRSIHLSPSCWSPFNSQSTWWFKEAFPLMYLPQYCTMRECDIIRSYVAQRCLWAMGYGVVFHSPSEVIQERNEHDLMSDFKDEIGIYLNADKIKVALDGLELRDNVVANMIKCYYELCELEIVPIDEVHSLIQWLNDVSKLWAK